MQISYIISCSSLQPSFNPITITNALVVEMFAVIFAQKIFALSVYN